MARSRLPEGDGGGGSGGGDGDGDQSNYTSEGESVEDYRVVKRSSTAPRRRPGSRCMSSPDPYHDARNAEGASLSHHPRPPSGLHRHDVPGNSDFAPPLDPWRRGEDGLWWRRCRDGGDKGREEGRHQGVAPSGRQAGCRFRRVVLLQHRYPMGSTGFSLSLFAVFLWSEPKQFP